MRLTKIFLIVLMVGFASCKDETFETAEARCLINGAELHLNDRAAKKHRSHVRMNGDTLIVSLRDQDHWSEMNFRIGGYEGVGKYTLEQIAMDMFYWDHNGTSFSYYDFDSTQTVDIRITKVDGKKYSGTFEFSGKSTDSTATAKWKNITISDGIFNDVKIKD